ncbi:hypothetical protein BAUCODRAFT_222802 [Baudoinia panamericana UAMH 10762]|uniref:SH3 domain-containing protein n=1 Tax=Baudoinia panamericana (strain UAMH 10762) TaxID=717646 RepID=M2N549_BAUPA|nr:uncharacterized protein BAUCODRAFT_222802 [Baudoinia panamericana UAMH 10762]EMC94159.1 hypothetical protein BAUCODRAFT_222802 [Baudoinia panamericana UAMH 10762]
MATAGLPNRFPCWCRATYSWGGETKKDLGFIEGDLIEALNAGDGSWWMGRLRRDRRAIGLFPSNFVKVLDESFQPAPNSRNASPMPANQTKSAPSSKPKFKPYASMKTTQAPMGTLKSQGSQGQISSEDSTPRIPQPVPRGYDSRRLSRSPSVQPPLRAAASPSPTPTPRYAAPPGATMHRAASPQPVYRAPSPAASMYRAASPQPASRAQSPARPRSRSPLPATYHDGSAYPQLLPTSRQPSPSPSFGDQRPWRPTSPQPDGMDLGMEVESPPPPPPPAHRVVYQPSRAPSVVNNYRDVDTSRHANRTPISVSPAGSHMTPSPLRDAMNDVMSSLEDMSVVQEYDGPPTPDVWSPEEYELVRTGSQQRAQSSLGFTAPYARGLNGAQTQNGALPPHSRDGPPELASYVQRMERELHTQSATSRPATSSSHSSHSSSARSLHSQTQHPTTKHRKSTYELGRERLNRSYTTKTNATNSTNSSSATQSSTSTQLTSHSIMSGYSAGGFSATSAGSLARRKFGLGSQRQKRPFSVVHTKSMGDIGSSARSMAGTESTFSGPSYHESHASQHQPAITPVADWTKDPMETAGVLGGLSSPKVKRSGFFKKMLESAKSTARTGAATARSTIGSATGSRPGSRAGSPTKSLLSNGIGSMAFAGGTASRPDSALGGSSAAREMGLGGGEWMHVRRDVNRSNSLSRREREERAERSDMLGLPALNPIDLLNELTEGDEGLDGLAIDEPTNFDTPNLALVDKSTRFIQSVPPMISAAALAQSYVCRPHRSDVQRLRAIFTWVSERITWEEDFEGDVDTRRVISAKRGCNREIAALVQEMCTALGLYAEEVHGYLKAPGEVLDLDTVARANHWWNAVIVDGEWRIMDCSLANPTNPRRSAYSAASSQTAEPWYFLARPREICYTHIPLLPEQQHIVPPLDHEVLVSLPCACPAYFRNGIELANFSTSVLHLENLEMAHLHITVPEDIECVAETEARAFARDPEGDLFESGDVVKKPVFAQTEWVAGHKRFTIKALLPSDEGQGMLKVYAGKRGLMHSIKDNPHALAVAFPLSHTGQNPPYDFHARHPTPHAQRHDLYVAQPQCSRLTINNTFVFCVRQHPSSLSRFTPDTWGTGSNGRPVSPQPQIRPSSAMSMVSASMSQSGSDYSSNAGGMTGAQQKPAKLAIQTPSQKIIRLTRKQEHTSRPNGAEDDGLTTSWETVIKIGERGTWRGLVLADRSARWCVFAEWECV